MKAGCGVQTPEKRGVPQGAESVGSAVRTTFEPHFLTQGPQADHFLPFLS